VRAAHPTGSSPTHHCTAHQQPIGSHPRHPTGDATPRHSSSIKNRREDVAPAAFLDSCPQPSPAPAAQGPPAQPVPASQSTSQRQP
jgi:hypothetical protein